MPGPDRPARALATLLATLLAAAGCIELVGVPSPAQDARQAPPLPASGTLEVHYVSVGQGDGTLWRLPSGALVVYDCGPPAPSPDVNPLVVHLRDALGVAEGASIHALVASHGHADHVGGCDEVFEVFRVERVVEAWYEGDDRPLAYLRFQEAVRRSGAQVVTVAPASELRGERLMAPGDALDLPQADLDAGVRATLLWPEALPHDWDDIAEASLVVRLTHGANAFCFQGDVEMPQERALAQMPGDLSCDAYLVGHHGSRHASAQEWLARMAPSVAVVSFGENSYGHPTAEALCRVQQAGAQVYATHRLGAVRVASDGEALTVSPDEPEALDYCAADASYWSAANG